MNKPRILFDEKSVKFVLEAIGYKVDDFGAVKDSEGNFARDVDDKEFFADDLIGIVNKQFITRESQIYSLVFKK